MKKILLALLITSITFTAAVAKKNVNVSTQSDSVTEFVLTKAPENKLLSPSNRVQNACLSACAAEFQQCKFNNSYYFCVQQIEMCVRSC